MNYLDKTGLTRLWSKITGKLGQKQDTLVSGTNIKTINNQSLLGRGNIDVHTDLTGYVKNTDYSTSNIAGVVKTSYEYGLQAVAGMLMGVNQSYADYQDDTPLFMISKGTLENAITGKNLETANNKVTSISSSSTNTEYPSAKCVYDELGDKQALLVSGTNIKTINNQSILGSGNINVEAVIGSNVEQKHVYNYNTTPYFYQFYGVSSIDNITVNVGVEVDVVYATLALITQSIEELQNSYAPTLSAIQGIHIPNDAYESNVLIIVIHNLGSMTCYINPSTKYVTHATFTNFANGYSVDLGTDPNALTIYYSAVNPANYLSKTNTTSYTPSENYNPATKKYVDDSKAVVVEANLVLDPNDYSITFDQWVTSNPYDTIDTANQANIPVFAKMNVTYNGQTFLSNYMTQTMNNIGDGIKTFSGFFSDETITHVTMTLTESNENNPTLDFREVVYYEGEQHANIADETNTVTVQKFNEVLAVLRSIGAISSD